MDGWNDKIVVANFVKVNKLLFSFSMQHHTLSEENTERESGHVIRG